MAYPSGVMLMTPTSHLCINFRRITFFHTYYSDLLEDSKKKFTDFGLFLLLVFYQLFCSKTVFALCLLHSLSRYQTMKNIMKKKYCYTYLCVIQLIHSWNIARFVPHPPLNQFYPCQQKNGVTPPLPLIIKSKLSS